jgi:hypothetical protein
LLELQKQATSKHVIESLNSVLVAANEGSASA